MRQVTIRGTNVQVSRWSFGTGSLHHHFSARHRHRLLAAATDAGFSHFDTSPLYGDGLAECDLGAFLAQRHSRCTVGTKVGLYPAGGSVGHASTLWLRRALRRCVGRQAISRVDWRLRIAEQSLDASLKRLRRDHVDVLFLHEPDPDCISADEFLRWLEREQTRGRIGAWGLAGSGLARLSWVSLGHPLARVLQANDSLQRREADALAAAGHAAQFTYGYLSACTLSGTAIDSTTLQQMLRRNPGGSIIVSTRHAQRLAAFANAAEVESCR